MAPDAVQHFLELAIGFAFAGMIATGYQLVAQRPASFRLLESGPSAVSLAAVPFLVFAAPFIIVRNTVRARLMLHRRFEFVMIGTVVAGLWSLMSGTIVVMAVDALAEAAVRMLG